MSPTFTDRLSRPAPRSSGAWPRPDVSLGHSQRPERHGSRDATALAASERSHDYGDKGLNALPAIVYEVLESDSESLRTQDRTRFETSLSSDFSTVRVHRGPRAAESADAIGALAYTFGRHVVLGADANPGTIESDVLLGHELSHIAAAGPGTDPAEARSLAPGDGSDEHEAYSRGTLAALGVRVGRPQHRADRNAVHRFEKSERDQISSLASVVATARSIAERSMVRSLLVSGIDWPTFTKNAGGFDIADYVIKAATGSVTSDRPLPNRYLFTCGCGLIDMRHFYQLMYIAMVRSNAQATQMGREHELAHEPSSRFAPEDTPSNALGAFFGTQLPFTMQPGAFANQLQAYLARCGPVDFTSMPAPDQGTIVNYYDERNPDGTPKNPNEAATPAVLAVSACGTSSRVYPFIVEPDRRTITDTEHLRSDSDIRPWIDGHSGSVILGITTSEKVRLVNRLLDGWVSDDDITAIEKIVANASATDKTALRRAIEPRIGSLSSITQRTRLRLVL
jgi:Domain of unknown function (DUF4157)